MRWGEIRGNVNESRMFKTRFLVLFETSRQKSCLGQTDICALIAKAKAKAKPNGKKIMPYTTDSLCDRIMNGHGMFT